MKQILTSLFVCLMLVSFVSASFTRTNVTFNGDFQNGTTLFTDVYHVVNSTLYGRDVYPIHQNCTSTQVCAKYNYTYEKNCIKNYSDICRRYAYHYERVCIHYASYNASKCLSYKKVKIQDQCIEMRDDICRIYKTTKIKGDCILNRTRISCNDIRPIGCLNPDGVYTNQLALENFKMNINEGGWEAIPYGVNQKWIIDSNITFRVDIPSVCNPTYNVDSAIYIIS